MNTYLSLPLVLWSRRFYGQDASAGASLHKWFAVGTNHKQDDEKSYLIALDLALRGEDSWFAQGMNSMTYIS